LGETLGIAFLGTLTAAILAFPVAFLAARNVVPNPFARFAVRRGLDVMRSVDVLIWALIWINVVGLGPFAGALAIACSDVGALGKLSSEAIENCDRRAGEGVVASGGSALHRIRFGLIPGVLPVLASPSLYFFESHTRSPTNLLTVDRRAGYAEHSSTWPARTPRPPGVTSYVSRLLHSRPTRPPATASP
ncbi:PhnE/PtxC family ABC transporter permease, partial [Citrobacter sp. VF227]